MSSPRLRVRVLAWATTLLAATTSCAPSSGRVSCGGASCTEDQRCVAGQCRWTCDTANPCQDNLRCEGGICSPASAGSGSGATSVASSLAGGSSGTSGVSAGSSSASSSAASSSSESAMSSSSAGTSGASSSSAAAGSSSGPDCSALDAPCFVGVSGVSGCEQQYKCPWGQVCVMPDDSCVAYPAPVEGVRPEAGQCYIYHPGARTFLVCNLVGTWEGALNYCRGFPGFDLGRISTDAEQAFMGDHLAGGSGWLGLNDQGSEGAFTWSDGSAFSYGSVLQQAPWCAGSPTVNAAANCVEFQASATTDCWADADCGAADRGVICSR